MARMNPNLVPLERQPGSQTPSPAQSPIAAARGSGWSCKAPTRFLLAWKAAALVLGVPELFHCASLEQLKTAIDREAVRPDFVIFSRYIERAAFGDRLYAASLYSFYDSTTADLWFVRLGSFNPGLLSLHLSPAQIAALSELMRWHYEW
jgi:hypothetical protein